MTCQGCIDFENGMGGENQSRSHGCGWLSVIEEEGNYSTPIQISPELKEMLDKVNLDKKETLLKLYIMNLTQISIWQTYSLMQENEIMENETIS